MPDEQIAAEAASTAEAEGSEPNEDALIDAELDNLFREPEAETPQIEPVPEPEEETPEGLDEDALERWSEDEPETAAISADAEYLKDVAKVLPNRESATFAIEAFQKQTAFAQAVEKGDYKSALEAIPETQELLNKGISGYIQQHEDEIVQRWIDKNDPEKQSPEVRQLRERLDARDAKEAEAERARSAERNREHQQKQSEAITQTTSQLLDQLKFTDEEQNRSLVMDLFRIELSKDPKSLRDALGADPKTLQRLIKKPLASAIKRVRAFEASVAPPKKENEIIAPKGGVGSDADSDELDQAAQFIQSIGR